MNVLQSTIEKGLYAIILLMFLVNIFTLFEVYKVINNHTNTLSIEAKNTQTIIDNQKTNGNSIKDYIACLITINPDLTPTQLKQAELVCFENAPSVK